MISHVSVVCRFYRTTVLGGPRQKHDQPGGGLDDGEPKHRQEAGGRPHGVPGRGRLRRCDLGGVRAGRQQRPATRPGCSPFAPSLKDPFLPRGRCSELSKTFRRFLLRTSLVCIGQPVFCWRPLKRHLVCSLKANMLMGRAQYYVGGVLSFNPQFRWPCASSTIL